MSQLIQTTSIKAQNGDLFICFGAISEEEQTEIIQLGFQRNQEGKVSLKDYYEGEGENSLLKWKGYKIKYDSVRKTKLYQKLKLS